DRRLALFMVSFISGLYLIDVVSNGRLTSFLLRSERAYVDLSRWITKYEGRLIVPTITPGDSDKIIRLEFKRIFRKIYVPKTGVVTQSSEFKIVKSNNKYSIQLDIIGESGKKYFLQVELVVSPAIECNGRSIQRELVGGK
ncbi:hypothetical protein, partial [Thermococcus sp. M39]